MQTYVVIVAGGSGKRMGSVLPKQFLLLKNKPVLYYTINAFLTALPQSKVIVVLPEEHLELGKEIIDGFFDEERIQLTVGGETRFHSVQNGLKLIEEESIIFVHDGVRCLVSEELIKRCYDAAMETGSAIPAWRRWRCLGMECLETDISGAWFRCACAGSVAVRFRLGGNHAG